LIASEPATPASDRFSGPDFGIDSGSALFWVEGWYPRNGETGGTATPLGRSGAEAALIVGIIRKFVCMQCASGLTIARTEDVERRSKDRKGEVETMARVCGCMNTDASAKSATLCDLKLLRSQG